MPPIVTEVDVVAVQVDTVESVQVIAPLDLPAGYHFNVDNADGRSLRVEVPGPNGVAAGQSFHAAIVSDESSSANRARPLPPNHVPIGTWRDGIFDCCKFGILHPVFCMGLFAPPVLLGQVMTRLNLNACGESQINQQNLKCPAFYVMIFLFVLSTIFSVVFGHFIQSYYGDDDSSDHTATTAGEPGWVIALRFSRIGISFFYYVFIIIVAIRTRSYIRRKYKIRPQCCGEFEDVACVLCCYPCMTCQLSRHTTDYDNHPAQCCSKTGLRRDASLLPV